MQFSKFAQSVDMSFEIPEEDKAVARVALKYLDAVSKQLSEFDSYLNIIYQPFSDNQNISEESILKYRGFLIRFKNKMVEKYKEMARTVLNVIKALKHFSTDSHSNELIKALVDSFSDIDNGVNELEKVLKNYTSKDFRDNLLKVIQNIRKQKTQTEDLINDRILEHINTNILANNWIDGLAKEFNLDLSEQEPYLQKLYKERENRLNSALDKR